MRAILPLAAIWTALLPTALASATGASKVLVQHFYETLKTRHSAKSDVVRLYPYFSVSLRQSVSVALRASAQYMKRYPTDIPPFEHGECIFYGGGDCDFTRFEILEISKKGPAAQARVRLSLEDNRHPHADPAVWEDTVLMVRVNDRWLVNDIRYGDSSARKELKAISSD